MYIEIFNFTFYAGLLYLFRKRGILFLLFIISVWALSAFLGIFYSQSDVYRDGMFQLSFVPFIFLFTGFVISLYPFVNQKQEIYSINYNGNAKILNAFSWFVVIISLLPFSELLYQFLQMFLSGKFLVLGAMYDDVAEGKEESLITLSLTATRLSAYVKSFKVLSVVLLFYYLQKERMNKYLISGLLMVSFLPALYTLSIGGKTNLIYYILYIIGMYVYLRKTLSSTGEKIIKRFIVCILIVIVVLTIALSIGRYIIGMRYGGLDYNMFLFQYSAESMYNFNENVFHSNRTLNGFYSSLPLFRDLGLTDVTIADRRDFFSLKVSFPVQLFYTFIGVFYADFGAIGCLLLLGLLSFLFSRIKASYNISLPNLVLLSTYIYMIVQGLFYYCYCTSYAPVYANILFYIIANILENRKLGTRK